MTRGIGRGGEERKDKERRNGRKSDGEWRKRGNRDKRRREGKLGGKCSKMSCIDDKKAPVFAFERIYPCQLFEFFFYSATTWTYTPQN
jgi:hypothetical protein